MVNLSKRLKYEFGDNYTIIDFNESVEKETPVPKNIYFPYKNKIIHICLNVHYPFRPPISIDTGNNMWLHTRYQQLCKNLPYMEKYISACSFDSEMCLYKKTYMKKNGSWTPSITADKIINQFIYLDQFIANSIKTEVLYRNYTSVPDELFEIIFSYLHNDFF
jgi:hypothetical protein